jgi:uncharacterized repeat protein (TIGR03806 family)
MIERISCRILLFLIAAITHGTATAAVPVAPYFNGVFPSKPPSTLGWATENAFPNLTFIDPVWFAEIPGTDDVMVIEKAGKILRFPKQSEVTVAQRSVVLDLSSKVQVSEDQGLYRLAFHPQFGQAGSIHANDVFACYSHRPNSSGNTPDKSMWRLSRFTWQPATGTIDPASESVLIQQYDPHRWHNGGALIFDNAGFLLVTCGDGGGTDDQYNLCQRLNFGFFGGVLRIDVDNDPSRSHPIRRQPLSSSDRPLSFPVSLSQGYGIPNDNPWLDAAGGVLEEFYAIGLRSPHSANYDPETEELWIGDVGQFSREELNLVQKGGNFQWPFMEGTIAGPKGRNSFPVAGTEKPPLYSYDRSVGGCIIGGIRYRGAKWAAQLGGKVLIGDNTQGMLSVLTPNPVEGSPVATPLLTNFGAGIYYGLANICTDSAGEVYMMKLNGQSQDGGTVRKLIAASAQPEPPLLLSATGLFSDTANLVPSAALVPFDVASPLWSDGAKKQRWIALPNNGVRNISSEKIAYSAADNWKFPAGTIFVKHFEMSVDARNPSIVKRLETRVIVCTVNDGKYGVTYRRNAQGTDAELISAGQDETFAFTRDDGSTEQRTWSFPSRADCMQCHTNAAGQSLGLRTHQINRDVNRPGTGETMNQLAYFNSEAMFDPALTSTDLSRALEARTLDDPAAPIEHRIRSYLDSNCAHCHQPAGSVPYFDARLQTPLKGQGLINAAIKGHFNLPGGCYLKPASPSLSALQVRAASTQPGVVMPPLGKHMADDQAVALLTQYINGITDSEFATTPAPLARYVRFTGTSGSGNLMAVGELNVLDGNGATIPRSGISVSAFTSEQTAGSSMAVIDGDPWTYWITTSTGAFPKSITLDLGSLKSVGGFEYVPRQDTSSGRLRGYEVHYSTDDTTWTLITSKSMSTPTSATDRYDGLIARRPVRCSIAAAPQTVGRDFPVTIVFDSAVTDFTSSDISVSGGTVQSLRGWGYYYVAIVRAAQPNVTVSVPTNIVNNGGLGNSASQTLAVTSGLQTPPVATFSTPQAPYHGPFELRLSFDQPYTGLQPEDFIITGATMEWMIPDNGGWRLIIVPTGSAQVTVQLREGAVMGTNGLQMGYSPKAVTYYSTPTMEKEAENIPRFSGFKHVSDPLASSGAYVWTVEGSRGVNTDPSTNIFCDLVVPNAGNYRLRAWTRADDFESDSFYVRLGPVNSGAALLPWQTNQGSGEVGSGQFHAGFAKNAGGTEYVFAIPAGTSRLDIYDAEDGARIDRFALIPERPFVVWSGTASSSSLVRTAALHFTSPVTGLSTDDFETIGGQVIALSGGGQDYTVTFRPDVAKMVVRVRENAVTDEFGALGIASQWHFVRLLDTYEQWATERGLSTLPTAGGLDPDGDGLGQLAEYALGLDPTKPDLRCVDPTDSSLRGLPKISLNESTAGRRLSIMFDRRRGGTPLTFTAEFTADFLNYAKQSNFTGQTEVIDAQWERITVEDASAAGSERARFGRLRIERPQ